MANIVMAHIVMAYIAIPYMVMTCSWGQPPYSCPIRAILTKMFTHMSIQNITQGDPEASCHVPRPVPRPTHICLYAWLHTWLHIRLRQTRMRVLNAGGRMLINISAHVPAHMPTYVSIQVPVNMSLHLFAMMSIHTRATKRR